MRSYPTTKRRSFAEAAAPALVAALALAGCGKRASGEQGKPAEPASTAMPTATASEPRQAARPVPPGELGPPASSGFGPRLPPAPRQTLEVVSAEALLGKVRALGGKGTLVSAWASWCGPCKRELPMLQGLAKRFGEQGVHLVLVSMDELEDREKAATFLAEFGISTRSFLAARPLGPFKQGINPRWPGMLPASFLFDAAGELRYFWGGEAFEEEVTPVLTAFVAGKKIDGEADFAVAPGQ